MELNKIFPEKKVEEQVTTQYQPVERPKYVQPHNSKHKFCVRCGIKIVKGFLRKNGTEYQEGWYCDDCSWQKQQNLNKK